MKARVQFFSRLRDLTEVSEMELEMAGNTDVAALLEILYARTPALRDWDKSILVAVGVEFVDRTYVLKPSDEVSIMPPVQGG